MPDDDSIRWSIRWIIIYTYKPTEPKFPLQVRYMQRLRQNPMNTTTASDTELHQKNNAQKSFFFFFFLDIGSLT
jgi:hypothetical protein